MVRDAWAVYTYCLCFELIVRISTCSAGAILDGNSPCAMSCAMPRRWFIVAILTFVLGVCVESTTNRKMTLSWSEYGNDSLQKVNSLSNKYLETSLNNKGYLQLLSCRLE